MRSIIGVGGDYGLSATTLFLSSCMGMALYYMASVVLLSSLLRFYWGDSVNVNCLAGFSDILGLVCACTLFLEATLSALSLVCKATSTARDLLSAFSRRRLSSSACRLSSSMRCLSSSSCWSLRRSSWRSFSMRAFSS